MAGARFVNANATYDLTKDFTPVSTIQSSPFVLVAHSGLPARTVKDFIEYARERPGRPTCGTIGTGQIPYWAALAFNARTGVQAVEVAYKSTGDAITDVIAGRVDYFIAPRVTATGVSERPGCARGRW